MTAAATTRELWDAYQDAGEDVTFWKYCSETGDGPEIRQLIFALVRQYLVLQQLLGIDARNGGIVMMTAEEIADIAANHWFDDVPRKHRTQERLARIIFDAISNALIRYEDGELPKVQP